MTTVTYILGKNSIQEQEEMQDKQILLEFNAYSFLPIKLNVTEVVGERIDICCSSPYRDFFTNTRTCYYYASYFSVAENSTILGK